MKILVIDDNEFKFDNIKKILEKVDVEPEITWAKSRNSGLISILQHNVWTRYSRRSERTFWTY